MRADIRDGWSQVAVDKVIVNGFEQRYALMADEELGICERYKTNADGRIKVIDDNLITETIKGRVRVVLKPGWSFEDGVYVHRKGFIKAFRVPRSV